MCHKMGSDFSCDDIRSDSIGLNEMRLWQQCDKVSINRTSSFDYSVRMWG